MQRLLGEDLGPVLGDGEGAGAVPTWAEQVYWRLGDDRTKWPVWPPYQGKVKAIAERKASGLTTDERLNAELAGLLYEAARQWYERARTTVLESRFPYR